MEFEVTYLDGTVKVIKSSEVPDIDSEMGPTHIDVRDAWVEIIRKVPNIGDVAVIGVVR